MCSPLGRGSQAQETASWVGAVDLQKSKINECALTDAIGALHVETPTSDLPMSNGAHLSVMTLACAGCTSDGRTGTCWCASGPRWRVCGYFTSPLRRSPVNIDRSVQTT
jgi:hypothetical protein